MVALSEKQLETLREILGEDGLKAFLDGAEMEQSRKAKVGYKVMLVRKKGNPYKSPLDKGFYEGVDEILLRRAAKSDRLGGIVPSKLYTTEQIASFLQVNRETVLRMIRRGDLAACKALGKGYRIWGSDLLRLLEAHRTS